MDGRLDDRKQWDLDGGWRTGVGSAGGCDYQAAQEIIRRIMAKLTSLKCGCRLGDNQQKQKMKGRRLC
jgi:hypothetical protein